MSFSDTAELSRSRTLDVTAILSFPKLMQPEEGVDGQLQYSCALLLDPTDKTQLNTLEGAINAAIQMRWKGRPPDGLTFPLHPGDAKSYAGYAGKLYINAKSKDRPVLLAWRNKVPATEDDLVPGYTVVARISAFAYDNRSRGVSFALNAIWVIRRGERLDGRPTEAYVRESIGSLASHQLQIDSEVEEVPDHRLTHASAEPHAIPAAASQTSATVQRLLSSLGKPN
jgi:hypothetical protein